MIIFNGVNKHFWKFVGGFLGIVVLAIVSLVIFQYLRDSKEQEELKALLKERGGENYKPSVSGPQNF